VTAPNGLVSKTYTVDISGKEIIDFYFTIDGKDYGVKSGAVANSGSINGTAITATVPYRTNLTALTPTITHSGVSISPASGVAQNFTSPVFYTVTAVNNTTENYTVTVSTAKIAIIGTITGAELLSPHGFANTTQNIDGGDIKAKITSVTGTDSLGTAITLDSGDYSVDNLSTTVNGAETDATLRVDAAKASPGSADITETFPVYIKSGAKAITAFYFTIGGKYYGVKNDAVSGSGGISGNAITVTVPYGADPATFPYGPDLTTLKPTVDHSALSSIDPYDEFWDPSATTYTVTAEDGTTADYTVTATVAKGITINAITNASLSTLTFSSNALPSVSVDELPKTINITISGGTVTEWTVNIRRGDTPIFHNDNSSSISFEVPTTSLPGLYTVSVLATVDGVLYSGSFGMTVQ
jgi:hypothetical protein